MPIKKKKRRDPAELVISAKKTGSWYDRLSDVDRDYVDSVVIAMLTEPCVSLSSVAQSLINELNLSASKSAVRDTLGKLVV